MIIRTSIEIQPGEDLGLTLEEAAANILAALNGDVLTDTSITNVTVAGSGQAGVPLEPPVMPPVSLTTN